MKLTWFGGTTLRLHIGGRILVCDPVARNGVDAGELVSGADRIFRLADDLPAADPLRWQPRRAPALLDEPAAPEVELWRLGPGSVLVDAVGEPPLLLATAAPVGAGRWGRDAVVVAMGADVVGAAAGAVEALGPRVVAVAAAESEVGAALAAVRERLDGTGFMALEAGLALEV
jgi:hypothetical protein